MPSSEVRYQRGDHYRQYDEDLLQHKRSLASGSGSASSSVLSGQHRKKTARTTKAGYSRSKQSVASSSVDAGEFRVGGYHGQEDYLTKKKVG